MSDEEYLKIIIRDGIEGLKNYQSSVNGLMNLVKMFLNHSMYVDILEQLKQIDKSFENAFTALKETADKLQENIKNRENKSD